MVREYEAVRPDYREDKYKEKTYCRLRRIDDSYKDKSILIIGDSQNLESEFLKARGFSNIKSCEKDFPEGTSFPLDIENQATEEKFDLVYISHVLEHTFKPQEALKNLRKMVSGHLMIYVPEELDCKLERYHYSCFSWAFWMDLIKKAGFEIIEFNTYQNVRQEYYFLCE